MKSALPKVMHPVAGEPMIKHVVRACEKLMADKIVVVVAPDMQSVTEAVAPHACAVQQVAQGTGDAVKAARAILSGYDGHIIVLFGDTPLVTPQALNKLVEKQKETGASIVVGGFLPAEPGAYGRLITRDDGYLDAIVEAADATTEQKAIKLCNGGIMLFESAKLWTYLEQVRNDNAKKEYYLTDCVVLARAAGHRVAVAEMPVDDVSGINTRVHLADAEGMMQKRLRAKHMLAGVTMTDPTSVFLCADTVLGRDVEIGPNVVFGLGVEVADNVTILPFTHLEGVKIEAGASVGPFARLETGSQIGEKAAIGNFVEIKKSMIGAGVKIKHLSYIGMASVGIGSNIGAGTITCNYDGFEKSYTKIGDNVFIGSNTALVAPVTLGNGSMVAAGSVVTDDVPADALAIARERQSVNEGWAKRFRQMQAKTQKH